jgi:hypothetical protein
LKYLQISTRVWRIRPQPTQVEPITKREAVQRSVKAKEVDTLLAISAIEVALGEDIGQQRGFRYMGLVSSRLLLLGANIANRGAN